MPLFEVAILEQPSRKGEGEGTKERLVLPPTYVIAKDTQGAAINAVLDNAAKLADVDRSRMQVLVRPFN